MKIDILSLFPEMYDGFLNTSIIKRAREKGIIDVTIHNFRDFALDKHKSVDDTPYGGGAGMVLKCQPLVDCLKTIVTSESFVILMSPQGITYKQSVAKEFSYYKHLVIICGHYEGFDERILNYIDLEVSIGDYVLTGGELSSMVIVDSITRLLEGTIRKESYQDESFENDLLEYPQYTKPSVYDGFKVPDVLLSGHHKNINEWRKAMSLLKTKRKRPDLYEKHDLTQEEVKILQKYENKNCDN